MNIDIGDLNWAAGMFEGEGSITIGASRTPKGKDVYALQCKVPNTDHSIIDFFHHHWPGSIGSDNLSREDRQPSAHLDSKGGKSTRFPREIEASPTNRPSAEQSKSGFPAYEAKGTL